MANGLPEKPSHGRRSSVVVGGHGQDVSHMVLGDGNPHPVKSVPSLAVWGWLHQPRASSSMSTIPSSCPVGALLSWRQQKPFSEDEKVWPPSHFCCYNGDYSNGLFLSFSICINKCFPELTLGRIKQILPINSMKDLG